MEQLYNDTKLNKKQNLNRPTYIKLTLTRKHLNKKIEKGKIENNKTIANKTKIQCISSTRLQGKEQNETE